MKPTEEQQAVIDAVNRGENILVTALAGAAKTTTLTWSGDSADPMNSVALAFNVKIKDELNNRLKFPAKTLNGIGYAAFGRAKLDPDKMTILRKDMKFEYDAQQMASAAKMLGLIPLGIPGTGLFEDSPEFWKELMWKVGADPNLSREMLEYQARELLKRSINEAGRKIIDFDDQIYMPTMFGGNWRKYDLTMVDEAQDLSALNHKMLTKIVGKQLVVVGDPNQSIYAWRGAHIGSMDVLQQQYDLKVYTLSTTFRCPKRVVELARKFTPNMQYPEWAKEGEVIDLRGKSWSLSNLPDQITFVCRNNAPLIKLALAVAMSGQAVTFIGAQRLEVMLKGILRQMKAKDTDTMDILEGKLRDWLSLFADYSDAMKEAMLDRAKALAMVMEQSHDLASVQRNIKKIFANKHAKIVFSTGHGAKGLEWDNVAFLDSHLLPSSYAHTPDQLQQEANLEYVIITRAKEKLFYVRGEECAI